MSKKVKTLMNDEYQSRFAGVSECLIVSLRGLSGMENNEMRSDLLDKRIRIHVVKNSLARRAFCDLGMEGMSTLLTGPCAVAYGGDSIVDIARIIMKWSEKLEELRIKGGYLDGQTLDADQARDLAKMPDRRTLQANIAALAKAPGAAVAGAIGAPANYIAGCIKTLAEKLDQAQAA